LRIGHCSKTCSSNTLRAAWRRDGGDGVTQDETAWTWWTLTPAISGCFAQRCHNHPPLRGDACRGSVAGSAGPRPRALGQLLADLTHRDACAVGGDTGIGDRREQGVLPEVVGLPRRDLLQQVGLDSAAVRTANWSLWFSRPRNAHSRRNCSRVPSEGTGSAWLAPHQSNASAARRRKTSPEKVFVASTQGRQRGHELEDAIIPDQPVEQDPASADRHKGGYGTSPCSPPYV
jgi:hypothetical protein